MIFYCLIVTQHNYKKQDNIIIMPTFYIDPGYTYSNNTGSYETSMGKSSISAPLFDVSNTVTLTSTLTPLSSSVAQIVTLINNTGAAVSASINNGSTISIPNTSGYSFNAFNANIIKVAGSGILSYTISK